MSLNIKVESKSYKYTKYIFLNKFNIIRVYSIKNKSAKSEFPAENVARVSNYLILYV